MNILFVSDSPFNPVAGGLERVTDCLTKELQKRGHTVHYLCGKIKPENQYFLDYEYPCELYQLPNYGIFDDKANSDYYKYLQNILKIDIVINQRGLGGWFNDILSITNTKLVSVIHSTPDSYIQLFLNQLIELTVPPHVKLKKMIKRTFPTLISYYWKRKMLFDLKKKYGELACYSDAIVTLSNKDVSVFEGLINISHKAKIVSIANPNTFNKLYIPSKDKKKNVLYVGRLTKFEKAPHRLLDVWNYLYKDYPDWNLKFVGDGDYRAKMQEYVKRRHLNNVFFEGKQTDVTQYYKEASFVCLTSNFEGWGMSLTEGMQYGCIPCTFNNYGAAFDIIDDDVNGCLIPAFDLKEYAKRLAELMSNDTKRLKMSKAAIEKVKEFSVENVADKWEELLRKL